MNLHHTRRCAAAASMCGALLLAAYTFYPGSPYWHLGLFEKVHYKPDLPDAYFPSGSALESTAIDALDDWEDIGDTDLVTDYRKRNSDPFDHSNGRDTWGFGVLPTGVLAVTYYTYSGNKMKEADIVFSDNATMSAQGLYWVNDILGPATSSPSGAISLRSVARHETGHAIGLDHEDGVLATMNSIYTHGQDAHTAASGMLPHADDKEGCRSLYPQGATLTTYNLMATCWDDPGSSGATAPRLTPLSGIYVRGAAATVPCYLENQGLPVFNIHVGVYLSSDNKIDGGDIQVGDVAFGGWWPSYTSGNYALPAAFDAPSGAYYVLVRIDSNLAVAERWESDNDIEAGYISIVEWDLTVSAFNIGDLTPARGVFVLADITVRNLSGSVTPDTKVRVHLARNTAWGPVPDYDFVLGEFTVSPGVAAGSYRGVSGWVQIPPLLCVERTWQMYATIDPDDEIPEIDETNNAMYLSFNPRWDGTGIQIGQYSTSISSSSSDAKYAYTVCSKAPGVPATTIYAFLWTGSGTAPGIPLPPYGTLPLNPDPLTNVGIVLWSGLFSQLEGAQAAEVVTGTITGDVLLAPLYGLTTNFAAIYIDPVTGIIGIAHEALSMTIR